MVLTAAKKLDPLSVEDYLSGRDAGAATVFRIGSQREPPPWR
jgi:hypothetical protein